MFLDRAAVLFPQYIWAKFYFLWINICYHQICFYWYYYGLIYFCPLYNCTFLSRMHTVVKSCVASDISLPICFHEFRVIHWQTNGKWIIYRHGFVSEIKKETFTLKKRAVFNIQSNKVNRFNYILLKYVYLQRKLISRQLWKPLNLHNFDTFYLANFLRRFSLPFKQSIFKLSYALINRVTSIPRIVRKRHRREHMANKRGLSLCKPRAPPTGGWRDFRNTHTETCIN